MSGKPNLGEMAFFGIVCWRRMAVKASISEVEMLYQGHWVMEQ